MNPKKITAASLLGTFAVVALLFAYPAMATSTGALQNSNPQQIPQNSARAASEELHLSVGQNITLTSVAGGFWAVGNKHVNGTASGTMTLRVTGDLTGGYILSVTGGTLNVNQTCTISGGSAELGPYGHYLIGQGQAGTAQFLFLVKDLGKFGSTSYGILHVDLKDGTSEFVARLLVTISA